MLYRAELRKILDGSISCWETSNTAVFPPPWAEMVFEMLVEYYERMLALAGSVDMDPFVDHAYRLVECYADNFARPSERIRYTKPD